MFVHEVMRHAIQSTPYGTYDDLTVNRNGDYGHQYYFFDTETEALLFIADRPHKQYTYQYREWNEPHISECAIIDCRKTT